MKLTLWTIALTGITLLWACGDESDNDAGTRADGSAGDSGTDGGTGGDTGGGDAGVDFTCEPTSLAAAGCGNETTGTWVYKSACGLYSGPELQALCPTVAIQATSHQVTGNLVFTSSMYTLNSTDIANITADVPAACAGAVGGCPGVQATLRQNFTAATCTVAGTGCNCMVTVTIGAAETGTYTAAGGVITTAPSGGGPAGHYNYCTANGAFRYRDATDTVVYVLGR